MLKMDLEYDKGIFFARLEGSLNKKSSYKINNYLIPVIRKHQIKEVIINLEKIRELDNIGISALMNVKSMVRCIKGHIYLCGIKKEFALSLKCLHIKMGFQEGDIIKLIKV